MNITYEICDSLDLIYINLREFDGVVGSTVIDLKGNLFFDANNNWIGLEVSNHILGNEKVELPKLKKKYTEDYDGKLQSNTKRIYILFNIESIIHRRVGVQCNVDFDKINGLRGIEVICNNLNCKMHIAKKYIQD